MKRSIAELCVADHKNDPAVLTGWLDNKTVENFVACIDRPDNSLLVAVDDDEILAVGSVTDAGSIGLNYVSPDARFRGASRALLHALEARAILRKARRCTLRCTETARQFYLSNGYVSSGEAADRSGPVPAIRCPKWSSHPRLRPSGRSAKAKGTARVSPSPRPHIGALARCRRLPDFQHLAR